MCTLTLNRRPGFILHFCKAVYCFSPLSELITATDGGQISMDWFDNHNSIQYPDSSTRPTILLLPGLTGTSKESYILHMIQQSKTLGYRYNNLPLIFLSEFCLCKGNCDSKIQRIREKPPSPIIFLTSMINPQIFIVPLRKVPSRDASGELGHIRDPVQCRG